MSGTNESPHSALEEVVKHWKSNCLDDAELPSKSLEDLQIDARTFFRYISKNTQVVIASDVVLQTKSSHEEALVRLIQDLGPALSGPHHKSRVRALSVLIGAIEGCKETRLSNKITQLLGTFLLGHCNPIDDDEYGEDYDSMIRDAAVKGLAGLTQLPTTGTTDSEILEALRIRMEFSWQGVERRCAAPETGEVDDVYGYGYGSSQNNVQDIRGGLSTLPRSKRALCFDLVRSAVQGVSVITNQMGSSLSESFLPSLQTQLVEFARFAANCILGESDPRCLLQLLELLHAMQAAFQPWFAASTSPDNVFTTEEVFDAVASYYPIQFTPPPKNIHGITREGLHSALLAVLTFTGMDENSQRHNRHTMLSLSAGLFLEQLIPVQGEEVPSTVEKLEALECLSILLFPEVGKSSCGHLEVPVVRTLYDALNATHDESSLAVSQGGDFGDQNKLLADKCRTVVSKVAFQLETAPNKALWEAFVSEPLHKQSSKLRLSPSRSKTTIAYIACLTASGGPRTLRSCLAMGLDPLIEYLTEKLDDTEDAAAAAHGIAAFFSSCRVATERAKQEGVFLHPHPLEPYANKACGLLLDIFDSEDGKLSLSIKVGVMRAVESLLLASLQGQLGPDKMNRIGSFLEKLLESVMAKNSTIDERDFVEWQNACCNALGNLLGTALDKSQVDSDTIEIGSPARLALLHCEPIQDCIEKEIYPPVLDSAANVIASTGKERHDRKALAIACSFSSLVAEKIVSSMLESLNQSMIESSLSSSSISRSEALSHILRGGGDSSIKAFHGDSTVEYILNALCNCFKSGGKSDLRTSVANLALPATVEEQESVQIAADVVNGIVENLLPAYERLVPKDRLVHLLKGVSDIVPPLSEADNFDLCVRLPILGVALHGAPAEPNDEMAMEIDDSIQAIAASVLPGLAEYVLSTDYSNKSRSAAASCLHASITRWISNTKECPVLPLVTSILNPAIASAIYIISAKDSLNLLALLGSAAAYRGRSSNTTAAKIASFLVELACAGNSLLPFCSNGGEQLDVSSFEDERTVSALTLTAASAYGSMMSVEGLKPLMKQRLTHVSLKYIRSAYEDERHQAISGQTIAAPKVGLLAIVCHVVCCSDISKFDPKTLHQVATLAVEGLSSSIFVAGGTSKMLSNTTATKNIVLASVLKIICLAPTVVNSFLMTVVTGLLRAYAVSDPSTEISCKLLSLQALEGVAQMDGARTSISSIKPAVVAVLAAAMNHPSGLLRQAGVDVRNAWYLVD